MDLCVTCKNNSDCDFKNDLRNLSTGYIECCSGYEEKEEQCLILAKN